MHEGIESSLHTPNHSARLLSPVVSSTRREREQVAGSSERTFENG